MVLQEALVGELTTMCSLPEAQLRTETRQVDRFELAVGASSANVRIDFAKSVKKYQRSSADKRYLSNEVRTIQACWNTVEYLIKNLLDFDIYPKPGYAEVCYSSTSFFEIYSFLRDRLRAVRVDLHVQNAATDPLFIEIHEICLRFELLSLFLLWGRDFGQSDDRKFDLHLTLTALSQTIDPLSTAYKKRRELGRPISPKDIEKEAEITSYVLLLSLTSRAGSKTFKSHYLKQPNEIRTHHLVAQAYGTVSDYYSGNWVLFLEKYFSSPFLSSCCLLPVVNVARCRVLWRTVRTNRPFFIRKDPSAGPTPAPRPERVSLAKWTQTLGFQFEKEAEFFLSFFGLNNGSIPPRQLTKDPVTWWFSSTEWRSRANDSRDIPTFAFSEEAIEAFHKGVGEDVGDERPPDRCDFLKQIELGIQEKYHRQFSRMAIVKGEDVPPTPPIREAVVVLPRRTEEEVEKINGPIYLVPTPTFFPLPSAPPKPERPVIPLAPLEVPKRARDSPDKSVFVPEKPPTKKLHEIQPPPVETPALIVSVKEPLPTLPAVESGFDLLATELSQIVISRNQPSPEIVSSYRLDEATEQERFISAQRLKYVALKCLRNWRYGTAESHRWKWLIGATNRAPARINP